MDFSVDLEVFRGPLDLLLYLVRKHEVEIVEIPVALIADQYADYLDILQAVDLDSVGDFLEMASTLTEIKSRMLLPRSGELEDPLDDPRAELVHQLLEYKRFRDAASLLDERSRAWQERSPRLANDSVARVNLEEQPIREVELWDLVSAFGKIVRSRQQSRASNIVYDDTPIHVYISRIQERVNLRGGLAFSQMFEPRMHKSQMIGMFLAILELVRHHGIRADQNGEFGEIWLLPSTSEPAVAASTTLETGSDSTAIPHASAEG
jgi:segregation and condensation protein A